MKTSGNVAETSQGIVYEGLTKKQEAKLFLAANRDRRAVKPYENFAVAVTAQEVEAVTINADVESCGLHVSSGTSKNGISAIQALKVVHGMRDPADGLLRKTLATVLNAWGSDPTSWDGMMLRAVAIVIHRNWDTIDLPSLSLTLKQEPVGVWKDSAIKDTVSAGGSQSRSRTTSRMSTPSRSARSMGRPMARRSAGRPKRSPSPREPRRM